MMMQSQDMAAPYLNRLAAAAILGKVIGWSREKCDAQPEAKSSRYFIRDGILAHDWGVGSSGWGIPSPRFFH